MKYSIEFIYKNSVICDVLDNWNKLGKDQQNNHKGGFVFVCDEHPIIEGGSIRITHNGELFIYNLSDFYRVKITKKGQ